MENTKKKSGNALNNAVLSLEQVQKEISDLKKVEEELKEVIISSYKEELDFKYKEKSEPFGDVTIGDLKFNIPKNVKWDQKGLEQLKKQGAPVESEYKVSETVFKNQDEAGKSEFMKYRTVSPGKMSIKIERK